MSSIPHPGHPPADLSGDSAGGSESGAPAVPAVLAGLIDDAALFPPENAPLDAAVLDHRRFRASTYAALVGRFLCPASGVAALRRTLDAAAPAGAAGPLRVGVIVDVELDAVPRALADVAADPRLVLEAVEIPLPPGIGGRQAVTDATRRAVAVLPTGLLGYVEVPRVDGWQAALDVLTALGRGAKLRTGGTVAAAFPSVVEVAAFFAACAARLLPLKCTAGLHHAVRRPDPELGVHQHGFLNLLGAAAAAVAGDDPAGPLSEEDGGRLAKQVQAMEPGPARSLLTSFGSCSLAEPVAELRELGLLS